MRHPGSAHVRWCVRGLSTLVGGALTISAASSVGVVLAGQEAEGGAAGFSVARLGQPPKGPLATEPAYEKAEPLSLLQMNLCLSGVAGCFGDTNYPRVVEEAIGVITARTPDAVTFNEACSGDIARIAHETGYHVRFAPVLLPDRPLRCVDPGGRGVFGNAVMTQWPIHGSAGQAFDAQAGSEERRWICVETVPPVDVCTTHLSTRDSPMTRAANDAQCAEFAAVLVSRGEQGPLLAAGDFNRRDSCAPTPTSVPVSARSDAGAEQLPGRQHGYSKAEELTPLRGRTLPASYTDHDFLLVQTLVVRSRSLTDPLQAQRAGRPRPGACPPWSPEHGEPGSGRSAGSSRTCA